MLTFDQLQAESREWASRNFPNATDLDPFMGLVEEVGELSAAQMARREAVELFNDPTEAIDAERDAIGDIIIYLADYCNRRELRITSILYNLGFPVYSFAALQDLAWSVGDDWDNPFLAVVQHLGALSHARLKARQGIRGTASEHAEAEKIAIGMILNNLAALCMRRGFSLHTLVEDTWATVKKRDWTKNRANGQVPAITYISDPYLGPFPNPDTPGATPCNSPYDDLHG